MTIDPRLAKLLIALAGAALIACQAIWPDGRWQTAGTAALTAIMVYLSPGGTSQAPPASPAKLTMSPAGMDQLAGALARALGMTPAPAHPAAPVKSGGAPAADQPKGM